MLLLTHCCLQGIGFSTWSCMELGALCTTAVDCGKGVDGWGSNLQPSDFKPISPTVRPRLPVCYCPQVEIVLGFTTVQMNNRQNLFK